MPSSNAGTFPPHHEGPEPPPVGRAKNFKLRVDEYDMAKMEAKLKQELAEIDTRLESHYFPGSGTSVAKGRPRTLSNDPAELRAIQLKNSAEVTPGVVEDSFFKPSRQVAKPLTRNFSHDTRELREIETYRNNGDGERNLLGIIQKFGDRSNKPVQRRKSSALTNNHVELRRKSIASEGMPLGSRENLSVEPDKSNREKLDALATPKASRRRFFSTNAEEMRKIEARNNPELSQQEDKPVRRAVRRTLTNNPAEMRHMQSKGGSDDADEEFAVGFRKSSQPQARPMSSLLFKEKHHHDTEGGGGGGGIGILPKSCPGSPRAGKKRVTTLSKDTLEMQRIDSKYDLDGWRSQREHPDGFVGLLRHPNEQAAKPRQIRLANNDFDMKRIQTRSGTVETITDVFGMSKPRSAPPPQKDAPPTDTCYFPFGSSGGGAPIRDASGRLKTGVNGKFQKDFYNLSLDGEKKREEEQEKRSQMLEDMQRQLAQIEYRKKQQLLFNKMPSEDLAEKIRKLDPSEHSRNPSKVTSDVTRHKLNLRYPSSEEARSYFECLKYQQELKKQSEICDPFKAPPISRREDTVVIYPYEQRPTTPGRDPRRLKLGLEMGQPTAASKAENSTYDRITYKLTTPFATSE